MNIKGNSTNKLISILAFISLALALGYYLFLSPQVDVSALVPQVLPDANEYEQINRDPMVYQGTTNGKVIGYAIVEQATGYQAPISMLVGVNLDGKITKTVVVEQQETPTFFRRLLDKNFFDEFIGRDIQKGFTLDNVDAISGSTISSKAVIKAVNLSANYVGENSLKLDMPAIVNKIDFGKKEVAIILLMVLAVYATYQRKAKIRTFALIYSIVILGFWYNTFLTYAVVGSILTGSVPPPAENIAWYILVAGAFGLILFTGKNLFCFWICPFGAFQELLAKISGNTHKPSADIDKYAKYLPGFFAWGALFIALIVGNPTAASYEPFATLFTQVGSNLQWILLPIVLLSALVISRFWCNYFCPVGYVLNLCLRIKTRGIRLWKSKANGKNISS